MVEKRRVVQPREASREMGTQHVLVVEDERDIAELIEYNLLKAGFAVTLAGSGEEGLRAARKEPPDLVLLDLMLPGLDGQEVCRRLRAHAPTSRVPVVMVTARGEEGDVVSGLEAGADDYVVKPFSPKVLLARVRAVLRRRAEEAPAEETVVSRHGIEIDTVRHQVSVDGRPVVLTFTEFGILLYLARRPGWVFTRSQIVSAVRGDSYHVTERSADVHVLGLRKKLGDAGRFVETVRGVGYRFAE